MRRSMGLLVLLAAAPALAEPLLLVANKQDATVMLIDVGSGTGSGKTLATLPTGQGPHEIATSPDGKTAVIANYGTQGNEGKTLTVVDLDARKVARTIELGDYRRPHGLAFLPGGKELVATVEKNQAVIVVDVHGGKVLRSIATREPGTHLVALARDGKRAWTTNIPAGTVSLLDLASGKLVKTAPVAPQVEGLALTPDGKELWVGSNEGDRVSVLDAATLEERHSLPAAGVPIRVTATPDGKRVLVTNANGGKLQIVDRASRQVVGVVEFPWDASRSPPGAPPSAVPIGTVVTPDSRTAYVSLMIAGQVAVVDLETRKVTGYLPAGQHPDGIALAVR
jgi:YVTN family beta-propeller protein